MEFYPWKAENIEKQHLSPIEVYKHRLGGM